MVEKNTLNEILKEPETVEELEIPQSILIDIILRCLYNEGNVAFRRLAQVIRVPNVLPKQLDWLRQEHLVEVSQTGTYGHLNYV